MPDRAGTPGQSVIMDCPFFVFEPVELSRRETEALILAARGLTAFEIGRRMAIAERTVKDHLYAAREKLGALNTTHAVAIALVLGHIKIDSNFFSEANQGRPVG